MIRFWLAIAGLGGLASVAAGAAAAHLARDAQAAELLRTGSFYGMVHAAALVAVAAIAGRERPTLPLVVAGAAFAAGIVLFSFSLFALALTGLGGFGAAIPLGGIALMLGWAALGLAGLRRL